MENEITLSEGTRVDTRCDKCGKVFEAIIVDGKLVDAQDYARPVVVGGKVFHKSCQMTYKYFSDDEIVGLEPALVEKLDAARGFAGIPFIITSGKRSEDDNESCQGAGDSSHLRGLAVDLACRGSRTRFYMLPALLLAGFNRIGIYDGHIHVDIDDTKDDDVMWIGLSH